MLLFRLPVRLFESSREKIYDVRRLQIILPERFGGEIARPAVEPDRRRHRRPWLDPLAQEGEDHPGQHEQEHDRGAQIRLGHDEGRRHQAHEQNHGWLDWVHDGQAAGITGESLRLEGLHIDPPEGWELEVAAHMQDVGWQLYTGIVHGNDILIGSTGKSRRIEMFGIRVVKKPVGAGDLFFQVHQQNVGWKAWTREGFFSGSDAESSRLEAIRIRIGK